MILISTGAGSSPAIRMGPQRDIAAPAFIQPVILGPLLLTSDFSPPPFVKTRPAMYRKTFHDECNPNRPGQRAFKE
jgi:hypothetical protein